MKLKYIELFGFKSFAEKTKLIFNKDISAVVGPNGSGKSNIADAIRWVLGEQSAKSLRGANMQDVIFAGTEQKKQMNMAQVSLVLDNTDKTLAIAFDEVNITRRVFRTGESEYLLNKSQVRLKDIRELFLDTGVGKDGYSLIGQGRIDEILNGRPEDRREIFEEAGGISKYKYKKIESEKRLVKTQDKLDKLIQEIKIKQQETDILKKQSDNAKEGIQLTSKLEVLELNILKKSIEKQNIDLINDNSRLEYLNQNFEENSKKLTELTNLTNPIQNKIEKMEINLSELREKSFNDDKLSEKINSDINLLTEKLKFYDSDIKRLNSDIENRKIKNKNLEESINNSDIKIKQLNVDKIEVEEKINVLNKNNENINQKLSELKIKYEKLNTTLSEKQELYSNLKVDKNTKEKLDLNNTKLKDTYIEEIESEKNILLEKNAKKDKLFDEIKNIQLKVDENIKQIDIEISKREEENRKILNQENKLNNLKNEFLKLDSEKNLLYRQYKSYDGYYKSVQNLLKLADSDKNIKDKIIGVLADLVEVDKKYVEAFDVALGSSLQNIVINNEYDGKFLIDYIKRQNMGRITFLPITKIEGKKYNISHPDAIDTLNNLIKYDKRIEGIIDHFLSKTILVKDMESAIKVSNDIKGFRVITLDGEIINSWGSMVGGKTFKKEQNSLINRKKEIDEINLKLKKMSTTIESLKNELIDSKKELDFTVNKLEQLDEKNKDNLNDLQNKKHLINEVNIEINYHEKRYSEFTQLLDKINKELAIVDFSDMNDLEKEIEKLSKNAIEISSEIEKYNNLIQNDEKEIIRLNSSLDIIIRDLNIYQNDLENSKIEIENNNSSNTNDNKTLEYLLSEIKNANEKIEKYKTQRLELLSNNENQQNKILEISEQLKENKSKIEKDRLMIEKLRDEISDTEKEKFKIELRVENANQKVNELKNDYKDRYSIDEETLLTKLEKVEKAEASKREINEIKNRLSQIGYFNYETIEQYNIIFEELEFMKKQYSDLVISRDDIIKLIKDIEKEMRENFLISFKKINTKFNEVFQILFDGGEAELKLDSDDVLTCGIDIIARPKGKKLKSIALLSGGEKAMTAVALLFAIFEINPAPFCVLDEIDAALDEANIKRYINYLKSLVEKTQFIIITHRKATMEMAEELYGVTMEEQGVSKVITLALDDYTE